MDQQQPHGRKMLGSMSSVFMIGPEENLAGGQIVKGFVGQWA